MKLIVSIFFFLCLASNAFAQNASTDWHGSWGFQNPLEKANVLSQAMAMKFVEEGGLTNNYYQQQDCNSDGACRNGSTTTTSIGAIVTVTGDGNKATAENKGKVTAKTTTKTTNSSFTSAFVEGNGTITQTDTGR